MGSGFCLLILTFLTLARIINPIFPFVPIYLQALFGAILVVAGYFNFTARRRGQRKMENSEEERLGLIGRLRQYFSEKLKFAFR